MCYVDKYCFAFFRTTSLQYNMKNITSFRRDLFPRPPTGLCSWIPMRDFHHADSLSNPRTLPTLSKSCPVLTFVVNVRVEPIRLTYSCFILCYLYSRTGFSADHGNSFVCTCVRVSVTPKRMELVFGVRLSQSTALHIRWGSGSTHGK